MCVLVCVYNKLCGALYLPLYVPEPQPRLYAKRPSVNGTSGCLNMPPFVKKSDNVLFKVSHFDHIFTVHII